MELLDQKVTGIYLAYRRWELYWLENKKQSQHVSMNYFKLDKILHSTFPDDTCVKILEHINCDRKVALDFDNKIAKVIIEKDEPFENEVYKYMDPKFVQQVQEDPDSFADLYSKSKADIKKL